MLSAAYSTYNTPLLTLFPTAPPLKSGFKNFNAKLSSEVKYYGNKFVIPSVTDLVTIIFMHKNLILLLPNHMKIAAPYSKHLSKRFKVTLMVSAIISILFLFCRFMPHGFVYPIEVRNNALAWFTGETFCLINLFVCLSCLMIMIMRYDNRWLSGAAMLFFPFLLVPVALFTLLSLIMPPYRWIDDKIYQSGDEYLIYQINPGREMDLTRTIKTNSPDAPIRYIWAARDLDDAEDRLSDDIVLYEGKTWIKQVVKK